MLTFPLLTLVSTSVPDVHWNKSANFMHCFADLQMLFTQKSCAQNSFVLQAVRMFLNVNRRLCAASRKFGSTARLMPSAGQVYDSMPPPFAQAFQALAFAMLF